MSARVARRCLEGFEDWRRVRRSSRYGQRVAESEGCQMGDVNRAVACNVVYVTLSIEVAQSGRARGRMVVGDVPKFWHDGLIRSG